MCGISGVVNKLGLLEPQHCEAVIDRMNEHLKHRGPDRLGAWHSPEDKVSLGHTRLSHYGLVRCGVTANARCNWSVCSQL